MQEVSRAWKDAQRKTLAPPSFVEIDVGVGDPEAQSAAEVSDDGHAAFSVPQGVILETEKSPPKYATLEPNLWRLDGTFRILPGGGPDRGSFGVVGAGRAGRARVNWKG